MSTLAFCATMLIVPFAGLAHAQEQDFNCANPVAQQELNYCSYQDYLKADKQLNAVYKRAVASQVATDKYLTENDTENVGAVKALKKAQRAWIDYRDGHCEGIGYGAIGGSMQPMLISGCKMELTQSRIKELNDLIKGLGN